MTALQPLETKRLLLRAITTKDAPFFYTLFNSEGWLTYIGDRNIKVLPMLKIKLPINTSLVTIQMDTVPIW